MNNYEAGSVIIAVIFFVSAECLGILCAFSNPGAMPNSIGLYDYDELKNNKNMESNVAKFYVLNGRMFKIKFCRTCMIIRPIGTSHCKQCNICIERYDHHCPWVGNCIGKNNYRFFYGFLFCLNLLFIYTLILSSVLLKQKNDEYSLSFRNSSIFNSTISDEDVPVQHFLAHEYWALIEIVLSSVVRI